jgi:hypothetical protein
MTKPLTQRFRDLYALGSMWPKWLRFLWLGMVVWFEGHYLRYLTEQRVTEAINEWHEAGTDHQPRASADHHRVTFRGSWPA